MLLQHSSAGCPYLRQRWHVGLSPDARSAGLVTLVGKGVDGVSKVPDCLPKPLPNPRPPILGLNPLVPLLYPLALEKNAL